MIVGENIHLQCIYILDLSTVLFIKAILQYYFHNNIHIPKLGYSLETNGGGGVLSVGRVVEIKQNEKWSKIN